jgi:hypothetical protein
MKSFFKIFFASLLAFSLFFLGLFFLFVGIAASGDEAEVSDNSILKLDLNRPIVEMASKRLKVFFLMQVCLLRA